MAKCFYCDGWKVVAGQGCRNSPIGTHVVDDGPNRCIYCDLNYASSNANCNLSPSGYHVLGSESNVQESTFDATTKIFKSAKKSFKYEVPTYTYKIIEYRA